MLLFREMENPFKLEAISQQKWKMLFAVITTINL